MVLIYSDTIAPRLQYVADFIFKDVLGVVCKLTADRVFFNNYEGVRINYSNSHKAAPLSFQLSPFTLLFENDIKQQPVNCFQFEKEKAFFKTNDSDFPFDIFAAAFYLISRYEEYLEHTLDIYGRYAHENAIAYQEGFLNIPLVNIWVNAFTTAIQKKFPAFTTHPSPFTFIPTYDIDIAYSYKKKGLLRNAGGALKSPATLPDRIAVNNQIKKDPFDSYAMLDQLHQQYQLQPLYFFLVAEKNGSFDKNILPKKKVMQQLIKDHASKYTIALHPSWQSGDDISLLAKELEKLQQISGQPIDTSRQHYIRFKLPDGYRRLTQLGLLHDHSMGYGSINGFRASVASAFFWYDLQQEQQTNLRIHPFCYMEANSFYEQKISAKQAYDEMLHYYNVCNKVNGTFISIWHNHFLGSDKLYAGWQEVYVAFLKAVAEGIND